MVLLNYICTLFISMKNTKEYSVSKTVLSDGTIYFIGNDFMILQNKLVSCSRRKVDIFEVEDIDTFKRYLDKKIENNETIKI